MAPCTVLVLTNRNDPHVDLLEPGLRDRGADVVRFDPAEFPSAAALTFAVDPDGGIRREILHGGRRLVLEELRSVWCRRPGTPSAAPEVRDPAIRGMVDHESRIFAEDLWNSLECLAVPAVPPVLRRANNKLSQLALARGLGLEVPPTLVTTDPEAFLDFYSAHCGAIVTKVLWSAGMAVNGDQSMRYCEAVSTFDVLAAQGLRLCPVIAQAYVDKSVELRVTVVGEQVFAAEIHSQESNHTRYDWRRYNLGRTRHSVHLLPAAIEAACLAITHALGLVFGAIDLILTPDGRYVFLEINPNGQFLWIEEETGLPIGDAVCDLLIAGTPVAPPSLDLLAPGDPTPNGALR